MGDIMAYVHLRVILKNKIDNYKYCSGRIGKNIINGPAQGTTPIRQLRYQDKRAERVCEWKLTENFEEDDLWITLTYQKASVIDSEKARKDISLFLAYLRRAYKKESNELRYIYTAGRGKRGNIHFHMVLNKFDTAVIAKIWRNITGGGVHFRHLYTEFNNYGQVNYKKIANYLIKNSRETFYSADKIHKKRFCASINLKMPRLEKNIINAKQWKKEPTTIKGYILDKESIYDGYGWLDEGHKWDCCRVQRYTLIKIDGEYKPRYKNYKNLDIPMGDDEFAEE